MGDPEHPDRLRPLPGRLQHQRDHARGQGQADPLAEPPGDRRGLALRQGPLRLLAPVCPRPRAGSAAQGRQAPLRGDLVGRRSRPGRSTPATGARVAGAVGVGDGRAGGGAGATGAAGPRLGRRRAARAGFACDRRLPGAALVDPGRRACDRRGRRAGRGAGSRRRTLDQGGAAGRRGDRHRRRRRDEPDRPGQGGRSRARAGRAGTRRRADLVGPRRGRGRRRRRARRGARRGSRLLPALDPERPRGRRGLARGRRWRADSAREDRRPPHLRRRRSRRSRRPVARRASGRSDRDHDVRRPGPRFGRSRAAGDELPGARRNDRQPRGPPAAPAPRGDPAGAGRGGLDRQAGRALRRRDRPARTRGRRRGVGEAACASRVRAGEAAEEATGPDGQGRPAQARPLPLPVLGTGGRARARAPVPAAGARDRALRPRREHTAYRNRRGGHRPVERHLGHASSEDQQATRPRNGARRGGTRPDARRSSGGLAGSPRISSEGGDPV